MKIVFNTWSAAFFNPGGGEVQLVETREHLDKLGVHVTEYNQWDPQRSLDVFHQFSILSGVEHPMFQYRAAGTKIALSTILWAEYPKDHPEYHRIRNILQLADIYFTNSVAESVKIARAFDIDRTKFHETRNGVADAYLNTSTNKNFRQEFDLPNDFILSIANIDRRKNTHELVKACAKLRVPLVLVGHVRDEEYYSQISRDFKGQFIYVGPVNDVEILKSAYQQARLFALPSWCETPGIAALEAASQGCRIVITSEGSAHDYFSNLVTYVTPANPDSIEFGLRTELMRDRNGQSLRELVINNFTWRQAAHDVKQGYERLLGLT